MTTNGKPTGCPDELAATQDRLQKVQRNLASLADLVPTWRALADEARARVQTGAPSAPWPPGYFAGVAFGLETAVAGVIDVVADDA